MKNSSKHLTRTGMWAALFGAAMGLSACVVNFDPTAENIFACEQDSDCIAPNVCIFADEDSDQGICRRRPPEVEPECQDNDGDNFGVGDACAGPDCNDDDDTVYPGALELCDGKDNDCDCAEDDSCDSPSLEIIDEVTSCESDEDCEALEDADPESDNGMRCVDGACIFRCPLDDVGVCATAGPDGGGAVIACETTQDDDTGEVTARIPSCASAGAFGPDYFQGPEDEEPCDNLDNNCNRVIDNGNDPESQCLVCNPDDPQPCSTDTGRCSVGVRLCEDNVPVDCVDPDTMEPVVEAGDFEDTCNGLDDNCDGIVDEAPETPNQAGSICPDKCPFGMVLLNDGNRTWCMDRFEASRVDATIDSAGTDDSRAVSRPGVLPWTGLSLTQARDACRGPAGLVFARKRLCTLTELSFACGGANMDIYPYGDNFAAATCNGADAGRGAIAPTGPTDLMNDQDFAACVSTRGQATLYDLSGNVSELALQDNIGKIFGGSFQSAGQAMTCQSSFDGQGPGVDVGFRCCFDPN